MILLILSRIHSGHLGKPLKEGGNASDGRVVLNSDGPTLLVTVGVGAGLIYEVDGTEERVGNAVDVGLDVRMPDVGLGVGMKFGIDAGLAVRLAVWLDFGFLKLFGALEVLDLELLPPFPLPRDLELSLPFPFPC